LSDQRASLLLRRLPRPRPFTLFPYTTLFRSPALIGRGSERSDHCCGDMPKLIDPIIHLRGVMDIRSLQKPLKEKYRRDPSSSRITLTAKGAETTTPLGCSVDIGRAVYQAEAHKGVGGTGTAACSG